MENQIEKISQENSNIKDNKIIKESLVELIYFNNKFLMKEFCLSITNKLKAFLEEDSILINEETINAIDKQTIQYIDYVIKSFESAFIKLNFSSASDCFFMVNKLRCDKLEDILILLKSSSKLQENLCGKDDKIFIKKWYKIDMRKEFRVVYYKKKFIISQRYSDVSFDYQLDELQNIYKIINNYFEDDFYYENFELEAIIFSNKNEFDDTRSNFDQIKRQMNFLEYHFIQKEDFENEIFLIDFLLLNSNTIKVIDIITEKRRNQLAYKLDDYDIKNFLPLFFEQYQKSEAYKLNVIKNINENNNSIINITDEEMLKKENKFFDYYLKDVLNKTDKNDFKNQFLYIGKNDKIIERDDNYNRFPKELIDNPSNIIQFLQNLEIQNNK